MRRTTFSLASILLLTAVAAVFLAGLRAALLDRDDLNKDLAATCAVVGLATGAVVGAVVGSGQASRWLGIVVGLFAGGATGAVGGVLAVSPSSPQVLMVGAAVLILLGVVVRIGSGRPAN